MVNIGVEVDLVDQIISRKKIAIFAIVCTFIIPNLPLSKFRSWA